MKYLKLSDENVVCLSIFDVSMHESSSSSSALADIVLLCFNDANSLKLVAQRFNKEQRTTSTSTTTSTTITTTSIPRKYYLWRFSTSSQKQSDSLLTNEQIENVRSELKLDGVFDCNDNNVQVNIRISFFKNILFF